MRLRKSPAKVAGNMRGVSFAAFMMGLAWALAERRATPATLRSPPAGSRSRRQSVMDADYVVLSEEHVQEKSSDALKDSRNEQR
jgi:hypothetical protein